MKQIFTNDSHIHLRTCDAASSYHFTPPITGSNIPKWDCVCELCDIMPDKDKKGKIIAKKCFFIHEKVINVFHKMFIFSQ